MRDLFPAVQTEAVLIVTCIYCGEDIRTEDFEVTITDRWDIEFDCSECGERNERWGRPWHGGPRRGTDMDGHPGLFEIDIPREFFYV